MQPGSGASDASILLAGEVWDVAASKSSGVGLDCLAAYRDVVVESAASGKIGEVAPGKGVGPIWDLLGKTASGDRVMMLITIRNATRTVTGGLRAATRNIPASATKRLI